MNEADKAYHRKKLAIYAMGAAVCLVIMLYFVFRAVDEYHYMHDPLQVDKSMHVEGLITK